MFEHPPNCKYQEFDRVLVASKSNEQSSVRGYKQRHCFFEGTQTIALVLRIAWSRRILLSSRVLNERPQDISAFCLFTLVTQTFLMLRMRNDQGSVRLRLVATGICLLPTSLVRFRAR